MESGLYQPQETNSLAFTLQSNKSPEDYRLKPFTRNPYMFISLNYTINACLESFHFSANPTNGRQDDSAALEAADEI